MPTRQHLLGTDDVAGLLNDYAALIAENERLVGLVEDLKLQLADARHPTVPADTVIDPHPAS